jgi:hypothetical protein
MKQDFFVVSTWAAKTGKCGCGKRRVRHRRFWQTLNPWNKTAAGVPKSLDEIEAEIHAEAEAWKLEPIVCTNCVFTPPGGE